MEDGQKGKAQVRSTIMQLSELTDLIGLRTYVVNKTKYGRKPGRQAWSHTRAAMALFAPGKNVEDVIQLFEGVGCKNEIEAVRWLLKNDDMIP
jgi:hypothetical protein